MGLSYPSKQINNKTVYLWMSIYNMCIIDADVLCCVCVVCIFNILTSTSCESGFQGKQVLNKVSLSQKAFSGAQEFLQFLALPKFGQSPFAPAPTKTGRRVIFDSTRIFSSKLYTILYVFYVCCYQ